VVNVIPAPTADDLESEGAGETADAPAPDASDESEEAADSGSE
jgi:large subunit ribosomal protein L25